MWSPAGSPGVLPQNAEESGKNPPPPPQGYLHRAHPLLALCNSIKRQRNKLALLSILSGWGSRGRLGGSGISMQSAGSCKGREPRGGVGGSRGGSLARLGLLRPPTDGLSSVPRSTRSCSNFIPLMVSQLGTHSPHPCPLLRPAQPAPSQPLRTPKGSVRAGALHTPAPCSD